MNISAPFIRRPVATSLLSMGLLLFGGLAFLVGGHMAISASGQGGVLVRADPRESDKLIERSNAELAVMRGRPMEGWLRVAPEHLRTKRQLAKWAHLGAAYARSLPPKH